MEALEQTTHSRYRTCLQTRKMAEESDARIERLEKVSQDQQGKMAEMMEMLRTLVRDKAQATGPQNSTVHLEQRREKPPTHRDSLPHMRKHNPCLKWEGFYTVTHFPRHKQMTWDKIRGQIWLT